MATDLWTIKAEVRLIDRVLQHTDSGYSGRSKVISFVRYGPEPSSRPI